MALATLLVALSGAATLAEDSGLEPSPLAIVISASPGWSLTLGQEVELDASASSHQIPEELVDEVRFTWSLGDGTTLLGERITHRFSAPGVFLIELTMEVFESSGRFHRVNQAVEITVEVGELPELVTIIDLETGFAQPGPFAALFRVDDRYVLVGQEGEASPRQAVPLVERSPRFPNLEGILLSGGPIPIGALDIWYGAVAFELAAKGWLASAGFGLNLAETSVPLTDSYPVVEYAGYDLYGVISRASLVTLGVHYEVRPSVYLHGTVGSLYAVGSFEGSSRLTVDGDLLPAPFAHRSFVLGFGVGFRIGLGLLSIHVIFPI